jgi:hypothetical protein
MLLFMLISRCHRRMMLRLCLSADNTIAINAYQNDVTFYAYQPPPPLNDVTIDAYQPDNIAINA